MREVDPEADPLGQVAVEDNGRLGLAHQRSLSAPSAENSAKSLPNANDRSITEIINIY